MKDLLRDRRTILAMMVIPLILVPVIFSVFANFSFFDNDDKTLDKKFRVAIYTDGEGAELIDRIRRRKDVSLFEDIEPNQFKKLIREDSIDIGLIIEAGFDEQIQSGKKGELILFHHYSRADTMGFERFAKTIRAYKNDLVDARLDSLGTTTDILDPLKIDASNVKIKNASFSKFAGGILPFFFVLFCLMGSMYPAIDLFTGEKERGTIETLLVLPTNRFQILIGKLLVISTVGILSGLFSFVGIWSFLKFNPEFPFMSLLLNAENIGLILFMMVPLTIFFAGLLIPISIYSKSFKEAQSLIQPFLLIIIIPMVMGLFPSFELNLKTAMIPVLNVSLASKEIVSGTINYGLLFVVYSSLILFAALGVLLAKRWFGDESNIFRN